MATLPDSLSLSLSGIAAGLTNDPSPVESGLSSLQDWVNALRVILAGGTSGQLLTSGGGASVSWAAGTTTYRKTSAKAVNTTVTATDLLAGEITVGAGVLGTTGVLRATLWGDFLNNTGAAAASPRWQVVVGGTTVLDTNTANSFNASATRWAWRVVIESIQLGAAASQLWSIQGRIAGSPGLNGTPGVAAFTTGTGLHGGLVENTTTGHVQDFTGNNTTAIDMSTAKTLVFNVINGVSNANYETRLNGALVEVI